MEIQVQKWGNSLALRIPQALADKINIQVGSRINLIMKNNKIEIIPSETDEYNLNDLLSKINDDNIHQEISTGPVIGNEVW